LAPARGLNKIIVQIDVKPEMVQLMSRLYNN
jgi:hypothetical protein